MTESLKALMAETEINNSFDISAVSDTLKMTLENSFPYLYRLQRNVIRYKHFYFPKSRSSTTTEVPFGDMYLDEKMRVCINLDADLIKHTSRDLFFTSKFYNKEFTLQDVQDHPELFERTVILSIDRAYYFDIKLKMCNEHTIIILPFKMAFLYKLDGSVIEHETCVTLVDNECFYQFDTHRETIALASENDVTITSNMCGGMKFRSDGIYMASVKFEDETGSSILYTCKKLGDDLIMEASPTMKAKMDDTTKNFTMTLVFFKNLYEYKMKNNDAIMAYTHPKTKETTSQVMVIDREDGITYNMPIPYENFMIFKRVSDGGDLNGEYVDSKNAIVDIHYPNMYTISDPNMEVGDMYRVFFFYQKGYDLHYTHKFNFFFNFLKKKLSQPTIEAAVNKAYNEDITSLDVSARDALSGTFRKLFNYKDYDYRYDTIDYARKFITEKTPYEYKVALLHDYISADTMALRNYVRRQNLICDSYYLFVKRINLKDRIRTDTSLEIPGPVKTFKEQRYIFAFKNSYSSNILNLRIWIDGILCSDLVHENYFGMDFIYIPCDMIKDDSYIEVENYFALLFSTNIYFGNTETFYDFNIVNNGLVVPTMDDIMILDRYDDSIVYDKEHFEIRRVVQDIPISTRDTDGTLKTRFTTMDKIQIRAVDDSVVSKTMRLAIRKNPQFINRKYDRTGYPLVHMGEYPMNPNTEYIRIFKNGRLMPKTMYQFKSNFGDPRIQMLFKVDRGDYFVLDISPFRNEMLYFLEDIPDDGIVDLTGYIDKPFDIKFFDVYLNGKKLNETNVFTITDTKIKLINIDSKYHLEIYQKERDEEYFGWTKNKVNYYFTPDDLFDEKFTTDKDKEDVIKDIIEGAIKDSGNDGLIDTDKPNTNTEEKNCDDDIQYDDSLKNKIFYWEELIPKEHLDPATPQFDKDYIQTEYQAITDTYLIENALAINPRNDIDHPADNILYLDPDINVETATEIYFWGDRDDFCAELEKEDNEGG